MNYEQTLATPNRSAEPFIHVVAKVASPRPILFGPSWNVRC